MGNSNNSKHIKLKPNQKSRLVNSNGTSDRPYKKRSVFQSIKEYSKSHSAKQSYKNIYKQ